MKTAQDIILKPIVTEESMMGIMVKKYTFKVAKDANKIEIKKAVEEAFPGTEVAKVNTMNVSGKTKRRGRTQGQTAKRKKAIVWLTEESADIEIFEGL
jgi:large subunit ribosomal protein L23